MGIHIHLNVSKSVTRDEWEKVYEETLGLLEHFPFAEKIEKEIQGIETICMSRSKEREIDWRGSKQLGWRATGDSWQMNCADPYFLPRDLVGDQDVDETAPDAMAEAAIWYLYAGNDVNLKEQFNFSYALWGGKSQGEIYHLFLLGVACLIEARLKEKAFVYGNITRGQCRKAVKFVNEHLAAPIGTPDSCDPDRLLRRVRALPFTPKGKMNIFVNFYLGRKDGEFGSFLREGFPEEVCDAYWQAKFYDEPEQYKDWIYQYLTWGFDLEKLCSLITFAETDCHPTYEDFVQSIMDSKLHLKEKNTTDHLEVDADAEGAYSIYTQLAGYVFRSARNRKVDRYIPIDAIRSALKNGLGDACNVDGMIDAYLAKETQQDAIDLDEIRKDPDKFRYAVRQDSSDVLTQTLEEAVADMEKQRATYDISDYQFLVFFETGNTLKPDIAYSLGKNRAFLDQLTQEHRYQELMAGSAEDRKRWLIKNNHHLLLLDTDWEKIFKDVEEHPDSFSRYYTLMRVKLDDIVLLAMTKALMTNDALYAYTANLLIKNLWICKIRPVPA